VDPFSKSVAIANTIHSDRISISVALDWIHSESHAAAVTAFFIGDLFLGRYAGNYFAKALLPSEAHHRTQVAEAGVEPSRVCLHCWHIHREAYLEDEAHVFITCPAYERQRRDLMTDTSAESVANMNAANPGIPKMQSMLDSRSRQDWQAIGRFLARVRQIRRKMKKAMQLRCEMRLAQDIRAVMRQWRREGKYACRHGVLYDTWSPIECPCLGPESQADWSHAVLMPALGVDLKCIVTDTFDAHNFQRLGILQASARRRNW
jgi:hypothetical protein